MNLRRDVFVDLKAQEISLVRAIEVDERIVVTARSDSLVAQARTRIDTRLRWLMICRARLARL